MSYKRVPSYHRTRRYYHHCLWENWARCLNNQIHILSMIFVVVSWRIDWMRVTDFSGIFFFFHQDHLDYVCQVRQNKDSGSISKEGLPEVLRQPEYGRLKSGSEKRMWEPWVHTSPQLWCHVCFIAWYAGLPKYAQQPSDPFPPPQALNLVCLPSAPCPGALLRVGAFPLISHVHKLNHHTVALLAGSACVVTASQCLLILTEEARWL